MSWFIATPSLADHASFSRADRYRVATVPCGSPVTSLISRNVSAAEDLQLHDLAERRVELFQQDGNQLRGSWLSLRCPPLSVQIRHLGCELDPPPALLAYDVRSADLASFRAVATT